jgi:hypothetical protein
MKNKDISKMKLSELESLADFYIIDESDLIDNPDSIKSSPIKLDWKEVSNVDYKSISEFGKIIKNYLKMIDSRPLSEKRDERITNLLK